MGIVSPHMDHRPLAALLVSITLLALSSCGGLDSRYNSLLKTAKRDCQPTDICGNWFRSSGKENRSCLIFLPSGKGCTVSNSRMFGGASLDKDVANPEKWYWDWAYQGSGHWLVRLKYASPSSSSTGISLYDVHLSQGFLLMKEKDASSWEDPDVYISSKHPDLERLIQETERSARRSDHFYKISEYDPTGGILSALTLPFVK